MSIQIIVISPFNVLKLDFEVIVLHNKDPKNERAMTKVSTTVYYHYYGVLKIHTKNNWDIWNTLHTITTIITIFDNLMVLPN